MKRTLLFVFVGLVVVVGSYWFWLTWRYHTPYRRIARGDSEDRVVALLGKPNDITAPHNTLKKDWSTEHSFGIAQREIVKEYFYNVPVVSGDQYVIGFDSDGRAVLKNQITSP